MSNFHVPKEDQTPENLKKKLDDDWIQCEYCNEVFICEKIPDEYIRIVYESRGEFWGAPAYEPIVEGFDCPECGKYNGL